MISFDIQLINPWSRHHFESIWCRDQKIIGNKSYCVEVLRNSKILFSLNINLNWRGHDHAGPTINLGFMGYELCGQIYDHRHWNYQLNNWEIYGDH